MRPIVLHYGDADHTDCSDLDPNNLYDRPYMVHGLRADLWLYIRSESEFLSKTEDEIELLSLLQKKFHILGISF